MAGWSRLEWGVMYFNRGLLFVTRCAANNISASLRFIHAVSVEQTADRECRPSHPNPPRTIAGINPHADRARQQD